jgi:hypothetical protein
VAAVLAADLLFDNTKRLRELISELQALSAQVVDQGEGWTAP